MAGRPVFLDTSLLIAASIGEHPSHGRADAFVTRLGAERVPLCFSGQVCREMMVVLTRGVVSERTFTVAEARAVVDRWLAGCVLLEESQESRTKWFELIERHQVRGKQVHDCNIVAVMLVHRVSRLATLNAADFKRYDGEIGLEPLVS